MKNSFASRRRIFGCALVLAGGLALPVSGLAGDARRGETCLDVADIDCARSASAGLGTSSTDQRFLADLAFHEQRFDDALRLLTASAGATPDTATQSTLDLYKATVEATDGFVQETRGDVTILYLPGTDEVLLDDAFTTLQAAHDRLGPRLGAAPPGGVRVEIYPTAARFIAASGIPAENVETTGVVALSKWSRLLVTSPRALARGYAWKDTIAHEYTHYIVSYNTADRSPVWLQEGVARSHEVFWRTDGFEDLPAYQQSMLATALTKNTLVPLQRMHPSMAFLPTADMAALAFAQVATMIQYLEHVAGPGATKRVLDKVRGGTDALQAVGDVGAAGDSEAFLDGWKVWLRSLKLVSRALAAMPTVIGEADDMSTDPLLAGRQDLAGYARLGDLLLAASKPEAALVEYKKAVPEDDPASPALAVRLARVYRALHRDAEAAALLHQTIDDYPEYATSRKELAELYMSQGKGQAAIEQFLASADINPFDTSVQSALATLYDATGNAEQAARRRRYERILRLSGSSLPQGSSR